jgi:hypothetical protein
MLEKFLKISKSEPSVEYYVFKNYFVNSDLMSIDDLQNYCANTKKKELIFNGASENDKLRSQLLFYNEETSISETQKKKQCSIVDLGLRKVDEKLKLLFEGEMFEQTPFRLYGSILISESNCTAQRIHTDYSTVDPHLEASKKSFIILIALMNNTFLNHVDKSGEPKTISLNAGDMLMARGTFLHGGAAYAKYNMRIHYYVDCHNCKRKKNATFFVDVDLIEHMIETKYRYFLKKVSQNIFKFNEIQRKRKEEEEKKILFEKQQSNTLKKKIYYLNEAKRQIKIEKTEFINNRKLQLSKKIKLIN